MTRLLTLPFLSAWISVVQHSLLEWHQQQQFRHRLAGGLERGMLHMAGHFQFVSLRTNMDTEPSLSKLFPDDRFSTCFRFGSSDGL